jgi:hypothetical protein
MEVAITSETSANFYQTTWRSNPDDNSFHTRRRENLKSHLSTSVVTYPLVISFEFTVAAYINAHKTGPVSGLR